MDSSGLDWPAWQARLDSTAFFAGPHKLGLGSSAAVLTAWAGVWCAAAAPGAPPPTAESLIAMHRRFQGGAGSGLDVATARQGGIVRYRLDPAQMPQIGSVRLPNSVGFAGIFAGRSASTVNLVGRYRAWQRDKPAEAAALLADMKDIAATGCATAEAGDGAGFVAALAAYGESLDRLGLAMDVDLVTREHREIGLLATQFDVAYKVSGAGGGDLGIAASVDRERLRAFVDAVSGSGFLAVPLAVATQGLIVEEQD